ncbi:unnamed protein product [Brassica oleracea var. botrytis]|uniref:Uncharacterized protein n=2 Tax=Brassica TaxID=3705 RepID=A0A3P6FYS1_BRAOL|nr:unnamed protein product [Brassica napus]VDD50575.1 unnamed protein product [Brassica oleracea]
MLEGDCRSPVESLYKGYISILVVCLRFPISYTLIRLLVWDYLIRRTSLIMIKLVIQKPLLILTNSLPSGSRNFRSSNQICSSSQEILRASEHPQGKHLAWFLQIKK